MKQVKGISLAFMTLLCALQLSFGQNLNLPLASKRASVTEQIGMTSITIDYHRPGVNGREGKIWGQTIPYGTPWRAGANDNTVFTFDNEVKINGNTLAAGKYGFHVIPNETGPWTLIFSSNYTSWGSFFYNPEEDVLRVDVQPEEVSNVEFLKYEFSEQKNNSAKVSLVWEKKSIGFTIEVDLHKQTLASIREQLRHTPGFTWQGWNQAAQYCLNNDVELEQGLKWVDNSISGNAFFAQKNFTNLQTKSGILNKLGREEESKKIMDEAIGMANITQLHFYGRGLIGQGKNEEAFKIFKMNRERHPEDNFTTVVGMARGYMAIGKDKEAAKHFRQAAANAPQGQAQFYENLAKQLEEKMKP